MRKTDFKLLPTPSRPLKIPLKNYRTLHRRSYHNAITISEIAVVMRWSVIREKTRNGYLIYTKNKCLLQQILSGNTTSLRGTTLQNKNVPVYYIPNRRLFREYDLPVQHIEVAVSVICKTLSSHPWGKDNSRQAPSFSLGESDECLRKQHHLISFPFWQTPTRRVVRVKYAKELLHHCTRIRPPTFIYTTKHHSKKITQNRKPEETKRNLAPSARTAPRKDATPATQIFTLIPSRNV